MVNPLGPDDEPEDDTIPIEVPEDRPDLADQMIRPESLEHPKAPPLRKRGPRDGHGS